MTTEWHGELHVEWMWCDRHAAPFRPRWPTGFAPATSVLFTAFARLDDVIRYCGGNPDGSQPADADRVDAALREFGPACCRVDDAWLTRLIDAAIDTKVDVLHQLHEEVLRRSPS